MTRRPVVLAAAAACAAGLVWAGAGQAAPVRPDAEARPGPPTPRLAWSAASSGP